MFHFEPEKGIGARLHWIIHGVHHDHPNDPLRLVMPPAVSVPLAAIVFGVLYLIFGSRYAPALGAGFFAGYLVYDMIHYYLHHFQPHGWLGQDAARAPHAPPLPGRHEGLRHQRALLGRGLQDLLARAAISAMSELDRAPARRRPRAALDSVAGPQRLACGPPETDS